MAKVEIDLKGLERQVKNLINLPMEQIGFKALELNFDQIQKKQNADGTRFKPYSESYADRKGVGVNDVDLTSKAQSTSGNKPFATMLRSFSVLSYNKTRAILGFRGAWDKEKAHYNTTGGKSKDKARPFVGLVEKNYRKVIKFAYKLITNGTY